MNIYIDTCESDLRITLFCIILCTCRPSTFRCSSCMCVCVRGGMGEFVCVLVRLCVVVPVHPHVSLFGRKYVRVCVFMSKH